MADEAFALSPISARAAEPSDADYAAIREAFMETSRGRWFLTEYAKRNRNADTSMVLDAVARIAANLGGQNQTLAESELAEALASIQRAVDEAKAAALQAIDGRAFTESIGPIRKSARVIREIAWRLREIGADGRICDLMTSQIDTIDAACSQIAAIDSSEALNDAFGLIQERIKEFDDSSGITESLSDESVAVRAETPSHEAPAETANASEAVAPSAPEAQSIAPEQVIASEPLAIAEPVALASPAEAATTEADIMHDEAVLDRVALAMSAPDPEPAISEIGNLSAAEMKNAAEAISPAKTEPAPTASTPQTSPPAEPSLGESLLASGIVRRPIPSITDPFAAIRRLSQAEKIAFFS